MPDTITTANPLITVIGIGSVNVYEKYGTYTWIKYAPVQIVATQNRIPKIATI